MSNENVGKKSDFDAIFLNVLVANGWKLEDGFAIASKEYQTAVGIKQALIYSYGNNTYYKISGEYISQGRNVLSTDFVLIENKLNTDEIRKLAMDFAKTIDEDVAESYAARLYRMSLQDMSKSTQSNTAKVA